MKTRLLLFAAAALATHSESLLTAASPVAYTLTPNSTISIFDPAGTEVGYAALPSNASSIVFSKDGTTAWVRGAELYAVDVATKRVKATLNVAGGFAPVLSPDGARLYVPGGPGIVVVDANAETIIGSVPTNFVEFISVSPDSAHIYATNGLDVITLDAASLTIVNQYAISGVLNIAALPDNKTAAILVPGPDLTGPILRLDLATGLTTTLVSGFYSSFVLSPNGTKIITLNGQNLDVIDIATGKGEGFNTTAQSACASPNGAEVFGTTTTGLFSVDLINKSQVLTTAGAAPSGCAVTPDSSRIWMTNHGANAIGVLDVASKKVTAVFETPPDVTNIIATPDGSRIFMAIGPGPGTSSQIAVLDTATGRQIPQTLNLNPQGMAVSRDGRNLIVENDLNGTTSIAAVDIASLTVTSFLTSPVSNVGYNTGGIIFSPDNTRYYVSGTGNLAVFDSVTNNLINVQADNSLDGQLSISPDGSTLYGTWGAIFRNFTFFPTGFAVINAGNLIETANSQVVAPSKGLVLSKDGRTLFSIGGAGGGGGIYTLSAVSTSTLLVTNSVTLTMPANINDPDLLTLSPDGTQLYISDVERTLIINTSDLSVAAIIASASVGPYFFGPQ